MALLIWLICLIFVSKLLKATLMKRWGIDWIWVVYCCLSFFDVYSFIFVALKCWWSYSIACLITWSYFAYDINLYFFSQRTTSLGSTDSNLSSLRSYSSGGLVDFFSEPFQASGPHQNKVSCTPQPSDLGSTVSSDLSEAPVAPKQFSSFALSIGLFQFPAAPSQASSVDLN